MTDTEIAAAIWPIYQQYVGRLNTADTRASFRAEVQAVLGPDGEDQRLVCDDMNNPPAVVASNIFWFDFLFIRDGKKLHLSSGELLRAHRAGLL